MTSSEYESLYERAGEKEIAAPAMMLHSSHAQREQGKRWSQASHVDTIMY